MVGVGRLRPAAGTLENGNEASLERQNGEKGAQGPLRVNGEMRRPRGSGVCPPRARGYGKGGGMGDPGSLGWVMGGTGVPRGGTGVWPSLGQG